MAYDYSDLVEQTRGWAEQASALGWINAVEAFRLSESETRSPEALFPSSGLGVNNLTRPLIVAFMGGTGVGKSSLINRLAGKAIAKAGIERPTSREVTLYHHQAVAIQLLPDELPLAKINISQHNDDAKKNIVWIDMPDFDSTEQSNKQLVLQWLPHIDVLIYVVSPERYRDDKAWRLLLAEGAKHAWLFAFNQWDRGQSGQYEDFNGQLQKAGFVKPVIFKTSCADAGEGADEFSALETTIVSLTSTHIIKQLEQRGLHLRKTELKNKLQNVMQLLGPEPVFQQLKVQWHNQWLRTVKQLSQGFEWPIKLAADYYAEHAADLLGNSANSNPSLWDGWAQARFADAIDELIVNIDQLGLPVLPFKQSLSVVRENAPKIMQTQTELSTRMALANPGNVFQRLFLKGMRLCEIMLPLSAMAWVAYKVFIGYYISNMAENHYLGADFAIHSSLLIAMTWLIPYFVLKKSQPSLKNNALMGIKKGLATSFSIIDSEVESIIETLARQHKAQVKELVAILNRCEAPDYQAVTIESDSPLSRLLMKS
jgi:GTPase SAR1 family protein